LSSALAAQPMLAFVVAVSVPESATGNQYGDDIPVKLSFRYVARLLVRNVPILGGVGGAVKNCVGEDF